MLQSSCSLLAIEVWLYHPGVCFHLALFGLKYQISHEVRLLSSNDFKPEVLLGRSCMILTAYSEKQD